MGNEPPIDLDARNATLVLTHGHFDHYMFAHEWVRLTGRGVLFNRADLPIMKKAPEWVLKHFGVKVPPPPPAERFIGEGDVLRVGKFELVVWEVPGHSPGSIALVGKGITFVGDLLFEEGGVGRTDIPGGDFGRLKASIRRILTLPDDTTIYPGHGKPFKVEDAKRWIGPWL